MKRITHLLLPLVLLSLLPTLAAEDKTFPAKDPVFTYAPPAGWKTEISPKDGSLAINSPDGKITVNFASVAINATMDVFEKMLPAMAKTLGDPVVVQKPSEHTEDGITGYAATYTGTVEGKPVVAIFMLLKGGENQAIVGDIIAENPKELPKEDDEAMTALMNSIKGVGKK